MRISTVLGIGTTGIVAGFLAGISASPAVGALAPACITLAVAILAALNRNDFKKQLDALADKDDPVRTETLIDLKRDFSLSTRNLGYGSTAFFLAIIGGVVLGSLVRVKQLFPRPEEQIAIWHEMAIEPASADQALDWIALTENLRRLGYSRETVKEILLKAQEEPSFEVEKNWSETNWISEEKKMIPYVVQRLPLHTIEVPPRFDVFDEFGTTADATNGLASELFESDFETHESASEKHVYHVSEPDIVPFVSLSPEELESIWFD